MARARFTMHEFVVLVGAVAQIPQELALKLFDDEEMVVYYKAKTGTTIDGDSILVDVSVRR